jgi:predicted translin family RNA/ssDNA-binding protein
MSGIKETFSELGTSFLQLFEDQRKDFGNGMRLNQSVRDLSKKGIKALKVEDWQTVEDVKKKILSVWSEMSKLDVPNDLAWQRDAESGQEMVEFFMVVVWYQMIFYEGKVDLSKLLPQKKELDVTAPQWLKGAVDSVSELSKVVLEDYVLDHNLSSQEYRQLLEKYLSKMQNLVDFLDQLETIYPMVINNSRRRGFTNTFRGALGRIKGLLSLHKRELIRLRVDLELQEQLKKTTEQNEALSHQVLELIDKVTSLISK